MPRVIRADIASALEDVGRAVTGLVKITNVEAYLRVNTKPGLFSPLNETFDARYDLEAQFRTAMAALRKVKEYEFIDARMQERVFEKWGGVIEALAEGATNGTR